jgi:hypothetical protein
MVLHSFALADWLTAMTTIRSVPDRAKKNFTTEDAEENQDAENN